MFGHMCPNTGPAHARIQIFEYRLGTCIQIQVQRMRQYGLDRQATTGLADAQRQIRQTCTNTDISSLESSISSCRLIVHSIHFPSTKSGNFYIWVEENFLQSKVSSLSLLPLSGIGNKNMCSEERKERSGKKR
jgi:hypothetical protein